MRRGAMRKGAKIKIKTYRYLANLWQTRKKWGYKRAPIKRGDIYFIFKFFLETVKFKSGRQLLQR